MNSQPPLLSKIGIIFLTWRRFLQRDLVPHKITLKQLYVLRQLERKEFLYPSQIADMLFCDRPTATVILKNLNREGWIVKKKDPENARQFRIGITTKGLDKLNSVDEAGASRENGEFDPLACFSEEEIIRLDELLTKMSRHMKKIG